MSRKKIEIKPKMVQVSQSGYIESPKPKEFVKLKKDKLKKLALSKETLSMFAKGAPDKHGGKRDYVAGDEKSFGEAFKLMRKTYGDNATFIWRGKKYNTKKK